MQESRGPERQHELRPGGEVVDILAVARADGGKRIDAVLAEVVGDLPEKYVGYRHRARLPDEVAEHLATIGVIEILEIVEVGIDIGVQARPQVVPDEIDALREDGVAFRVCGGARDVIRLRDPNTELVARLGAVARTRAGQKRKEHGPGDRPASIQHPRPCGTPRHDTPLEHRRIISFFAAADRRLPLAPC